MPRSTPTASARGPVRLLLADADVGSARLLASNLGRPGRLLVETFTTVAEVAERLGQGGVDVVVTALVLADGDGLELVRRARAASSDLPILVIAARPTIEQTVAAVRAGATDLLAKPVNVTQLQGLLDNLVVYRPRPEPATTAGAGGAARYIRGDHPRLAAIRNFAEQVARVPDARVLITGETGTGKSRLAHAIHELSGTSGRLVEVNCAALPPQLLESELFGHEAGAFTDARSQKRGLVELADRGTLFLDEVGTMPLELQAKLLLFIERREIRRVGGADTVPVRCRLIAATHENLHQRVRDRTFRQDLLFRLDVAAVEMPPLREMPALIPELARLFVGELAGELGVAAPEVDQASLAALADYSWPGNLRELRNAIERALIFHRDGPLAVTRPLAGPATDLVEGTPGVLIPLGLDLEQVERRYLAALLERAAPGQLSELAATLGISRKTLWEKRRRFGL